MFKVIFLVKRKAGLSKEQYQAHSDGVHAPIVLTLPELRKYVVNYAISTDAEGDPPHDGVIELWFDSADDFQRALASEQGQQALADQANFLDVSATMMLPVEERSWA